MTKLELRQIIREEIAKTLNEKHTKIEDLDRYISLTNPSAENDDNDYKEIDRIERAAKKDGTLDDLIRASTIKHWGRYDPQPGLDKLKWREEWIKSTENRINKNGKLNKNSAHWLKNQIKRGY